MLPFIYDTYSERSPISSNINFSVHVTLSCSDNSHLRPILLITFLSRAFFAEFLLSKGSNYALSSKIDIMLHVSLNLPKSSRQVFPFVFGTCPIFGAEIVCQGLFDFNIWNTPNVSVFRWFHQNRCPSHIQLDKEEENNGKPQPWKTLPSVCAKRKTHHHRTNTDFDSHFLSVVNYGITAMNRSSLGKRTTTSGDSPEAIDIDVSQKWDQVVAGPPNRR